MARRKKTISPFAHLYERTPSYVLENGTVIEQGDIIKIQGIHGIKFRFIEHVVKTDNNKEWIDCIELEKGTPCGTRSFYADRIRTIPKRTKRRKSV